MYLLAVETTGPWGSAAILNLDSGEIKMEITKENMSHLKNLAPLAEKLLAEIEGPSNLAAVAASIGPGSFTGIRIGVTFARSLAQGLEIPAISVPTLSVFGERCRGMGCAGILNARRGQVYGVVYDGLGNEILPGGPYMLKDVLEITKDKPEIVFYGDGSDAYIDELRDKVVAEENVRYQTADLVAKIAERKFKNGEMVSYEELLPDYMRLAEAEQKLRDGSLAKEREAKMKRFITGGKH